MSLILNLKSCDDILPLIVRSHFAFLFPHIRIDKTPVASAQLRAIDSEKIFFVSRLSKSGLESILISGRFLLYFNFLYASKCQMIYSQRLIGNIESLFFLKISGK